MTKGWLARGRWPGDAFDCHIERAIESTLALPACSSAGRTLQTSAGRRRPCCCECAYDGSALRIALIPHRSLAARMLVGRRKGAAWNTHRIEGSEH